MRKIKFRLDRKSLETIYTAFIRPLIQYAYAIYDYNIWGFYAWKFAFDMSKVNTRTVSSEKSEKRLLGLKCTNVLFIYLFTTYELMQSNFYLIARPPMFAVQAKIYGEFYNQSSSIAFDETSSY